MSAGQRGSREKVHEYRTTGQVCAAIKREILMAHITHMIKRFYSLVLKKNLPKAQIFHKCVCYLKGTTHWRHSWPDSLQLHLSIVFHLAGLKLDRDYVFLPKNSRNKDIFWLAFVFFIFILI